MLARIGHSTSLRILVLIVLSLTLFKPTLAASTRSNASSRSDNGAIAYHRASGSYGFAVDRRTAREAKVEALKQCNNADCEVVMAIKNGCGALSAYQKTYFVSRGATRAEAESKSKRQCGPKCEVIVWVCTK
ncbi:MAG: DUF4189 domain-containing protein [Burkholderiales bacterium]